MNDHRCEVVLFCEEHDGSLSTMSPSHVGRIVDLWAERTETLGARSDVDYVLVFENRGADVGATIAHPHGQIYAYDHVPPRQSRRLARAWRPDDNPGERNVIEADGWRAWVPYAATFPLAVEIAPLQHIADLPSMNARERAAFASILVEVLRRIDQHHDATVPYMMWLNQRPTTADGYADAWFSAEIVSPWRSSGVMRYIAAAELASEEYFNPVVPEELARALRRRRNPDSEGDNR